MFQRFHDNSQISRFVKNLLATEPIPVLQCVDVGDYLIENCSYIYRNSVVRCKDKQSGILTVDEDNIEYTSFSADAYEYTSKVSWYDGDTHKHLGNYLRYLRDTRSLDLMKYYNCYNATELTDVYLPSLESTSLVCSNTTILPRVDELQLLCGGRQKPVGSLTYCFGSLSGYRVVAVPIRFDTTYTVAVDCYDIISLRGIIYNQTGMVPKETGGYYSDYLDYSSVILSKTSFSNPFTYRVDLANSSCSLSPEVKKELYTRQKDLYLILQVPSNVDSSIVVLEGDYSQENKDVIVEIHNPGYRDDTVKTSPSSIAVNYRYPENFSNLSLLNYNTGVSYAFSDRLVEYLLLNVISPLETLPTNIARVQDSLTKLYLSYYHRIQDKYAIRGMWDDEIAVNIRNLVFQNLDSMEYPYDHDGHINKDVEWLLSLKGVYNT